MQSIMLLIWYPMSNTSVLFLVYCSQDGAHVAAIDPLSHTLTDCRLTLCISLCPSYTV